MFNCSNSEVNKIDSNVEKTTLKFEEVSSILNSPVFAFDIDFLETENVLLDKDEVEKFKLQNKEDFSLDVFLNKDEVEKFKSRYKNKKLNKDERDYSFNECGVIMYLLRNNCLDNADNIKKALDILNAKLEDILLTDKKKKY